MKQFPMMQMDRRSRDITTTFGGYNAKLDCVDGEFLDMDNMTSDYYPILSPRDRRYIRSMQITNFQGMLGKEKLYFVADNQLYINFTKITLPTGYSISNGMKTLETMGSRLIIFPDKIMYDQASSSWSKLGVTATTSSTGVIMVLRDGQTAITAQPSSYYESHDPSDGAYKYDTITDEAGNKQTAIVYKYNGLQSMWTPVQNLLYVIAFTGTMPSGYMSFNDGDVIKVKFWGSDSNVTVGGNVSKTLFPHEENGYRYGYAKVHKPNSSALPSLDFGVVPNGGVIEFNNQSVFVFEREVPALDYVTEYNNRLWGVEKNGHEIWACKLGDPTNWNAFDGISTDAWRATVGSDGKFTGAITYNGYPMMFKEHSAIKIAVSSTGAHQYKEIFMDGVEDGSAESLREIDGVLYYKGVRGVYAYNGGVPVCISDKLGETQYQNANAGDLDGKYILWMYDSGLNAYEFTYDTRTGIWAKRKSDAYIYAKYEDDIVAYGDGKFYTKYLHGTGQMEDARDIKWFVESGNIGYYDTRSLRKAGVYAENAWYILRMSVRIALEKVQPNSGIALHPTNEASVSFYIEYDSSGEWEHVFTLNNIGVKTFTMPIRPHRCDHFRYKIAGNGSVKILSITKTIAGGSDK